MHLVRAFWFDDMFLDFQSRYTRTTPSFYSSIPISSPQICLKQRTRTRVPLGSSFLAADDEVILTSHKRGEGREVSGGRFFPTIIPSPFVTKSVGEARRGSG